MADQAISKDYGTTVAAETYVSGIMVHVWLSAMYEIMIQQTVGEIARRLEKNPSGEVIVYDLGCGPGHFTLALASRVEAELKDKALKVSIIGVDTSSSFLQYAHTKSFDLHPRAQRLVRFHEGEVCKLKVEQADIITTSGFLHHFSPDEKGEVLDKMYSLLVEDGLLIDGDEYPAPYEWFEKQFPGHGRQLSICCLYLQVIAGAHKAKHYDLRDAEVENCVAELYRDVPGGTPNCDRGQLLFLITTFAEDFMRVLLTQGREASCLLILHMMDRIRANSGGPQGAERLSDRGDFKEPLSEFKGRLERHGFRCSATFDTGSNELVGSASVSVFQKM